MLPKGGSAAVVVYLDAVFLLELLSDGAALWITAVLCGGSYSVTRLVTAAAVGGTYGVLCRIPGLAFLRWWPISLALPVGMVCLALPRRRGLWRRTALFLLLSNTLAGAITALSEGGRPLRWGTFFLAAGGCYGALSLAFRGSAGHAAAGELSRLQLMRGKRRASVTALVDTGHTLTDPVTGEGVITVFWEAVADLWTKEERKALARLAGQGAALCLQQLPPGQFRLLPYRAVGVERGLLLCLRTDSVLVNGRDIGARVVALSPTPVSDGGGYAALWNGERKEGAEHAA